MAAAASSSMAVDRVEAGKELTGAETPDHDSDDPDRDRRAGPPTHASHGSIKRSAWPTVTASAPATSFQTAASVEIGIGSQRGLMLARGVHPGDDPLDCEVVFHVMCCVEVRGTSAGGLTARPPCERFSATFRGLIITAALRPCRSIPALWT